MSIQTAMRTFIYIGIIVVFEVAFGSIPLRGQTLSSQTEGSPIETDRDSFTRSPRLVEYKKWVVEGSYTFLDQNAEHEGHLFPDLLVRYGVSELLELRMGWNYEIGKFHQLLPAGTERSEEGILNYGAKIALTTADSWLPTSALMVTGYTPTSGPSNDTDLSLEYAGGWTLANEWEFDTGLRWFMLSEEEDRFTEWAPSVVLKAPIWNDRANIHLEYFCLLSRGREEEYRQHYLGPGMHFLVTPNMEIGTRLFWGLNEDAANFACNVGTGIRF
ncbi:transporter [Pirellulaceae bacterium SH449]